MVKTRKALLGLIIGTIASMTTSIIALAGTWQSDTKGWWYQNDDGSYVANDWRWIDGNQDGIAECYYFDSNGWMYASGVTPDGYTVNENGSWVTNGKVEIKSVENNHNTDLANDYAGDYTLVKNVYPDGSVVTGDGLYSTYQVMTLRVTNVTESSLSIIYDYKEGDTFDAQGTYIFTKNGAVYQNRDPATGLVANIRLEADGTLVIFDDVYGNSYYRK